MTAAEILAQFESLGENCEFGAAQRHAGIEPFGLFRWANTPRDTLRRLMECRFEGFGEPDTVSLTLRDEAEWMVTDATFGWKLHTWTERHVSGHDETLERERRRLPYLKGRLLALLAEASRTFVWWGLDSPISDTEAEEMLTLLEDYGPNRLLYVTCGVSHRVTRRRAGLYHGTLPRFASPGDVLNTTDWEGWETLCRQVLVSTRD